MRHNTASHSDWPSTRQDSRAQSPTDGHSTLETEQKLDSPVNMRAVDRQLGVATHGHEGVSMYEEEITSREGVHVWRVALNHMHGLHVGT